MNQDPLSKLFVSESQDINKQQLADLLSPYLTINKESQGFDFTEAFRSLPNTKMILILLAGLKARHLVLKTDDKIPPSEIIKMEIMPSGSVKSSLKKLFDEGEIKSENGKYYVPNYKISKLVSMFEIKF
jgi:hypothetical protein